MHSKNQYSFGNSDEKRYLQPHYFIHEMKHHENIELGEREKIASSFELGV